MAASTRLILPFLKWAGGKRWLSSALSPVISKCDGTYFEPFLGSAAVFFHSRPARAVLADVNAELIECYQIIRDDPTAVERDLEKLALKDPAVSYYEVRGEKPETASARAARFLYLNRTCWNGLYRVNLRGEFNVPRGTKTKIILPTDDFTLTSKSLRTAEIIVSDFESVISRAKRGDIVFADPPYTVTHNLNGFIKYNQKIFSWADQERLATALIEAAGRGATIICTNADHPSVTNLYDHHFETFPIARSSVIAASSQNRRKTTELLISNAGVSFA